MKKSPKSSLDGTICTREYLELRIDELEKRIIQQAELLALANDRDKVIINERLTSMNEFRNSLKDQAANFVDRKEFDLRLRPVETSLLETKTRIAMTMWGIGVFFVVVQITLRILWAK